MSTATAVKAQDLVGTWIVDPAHSSLSFSAKHMMISTVSGSFADFEASFTIGEDLAASTARAEIDTSSIQSGSPDRDDHLKSPDFLDVERFPKITFASIGLEVVSETEAKLNGDLTIKGITKPVTLDVEFEGTTPDLFTDGTRVAFTATTKFDREDFGLTWNKALETGGVLVGKTVKLSLEVAAVKQ
jgi:polyisoprenoid-binding protein YceI